MQHGKYYISPKLVLIDIDSQICSVAMSPHTPTIPSDELMRAESGMIGFSNTNSKITNDRIFQDQMNFNQTTPFNR